MREFGLGGNRHWKQDRTPVTATDLEINQLVLHAIATQYPDHSVIAEEGSAAGSQSEWVWVCDPIDGTIPFAHGLPICTFSLALTRDGRSVLGVVFDPFCDRMFVAGHGAGATVNEAAIAVSSATSLRSTVVDLEARIAEPTAGAASREALKYRGAIVLGLYSFVYAATLVAAGELSAAVYTYPHPWDAAAAAAVVTEAGGRATDLTGKDPRYDAPLNGLIVSNGHVHDEVLAAVSSEPGPLVQ